MRILLCCPVAVDPKYGAAKVYLEVAAAFRRLGWEATIVGPDEVGVASHRPEYKFALREYLRSRAAAFDVVEYEHDRLPFPRDTFPRGPLLVARSVLLVHQVLAARIPTRPGLRAWAGNMLFGRSRRRKLERIVADATFTCREADLVNVPTADDRDELVRNGIDLNRIVVFPYALTAERFAELSRTSPAELPPTVAFVGTFDPRKGMRDLPLIAAGVCATVPDARFRLIGTRGMVQTAAEVTAAFPRHIRNRVEVTPTFRPEELPVLLSGCAAGVFPSCVEGFPFGVLEMLAAGLPVVAYRVPGPSAMLTDEFLAPRGDINAVVQKLRLLLADLGGLVDASRSARSRAKFFCWENVISHTAVAYAEHHCRSTTHTTSN